LLRQSNELAEKRPRRRFITRDQLRAATTSVTNAKMLGIVKRKRKSALLAPLGHFPNLNVKLP